MQAPQLCAEVFGDIARSEGTILSKLGVACAENAGDSVGKLFDTLGNIAAIAPVAGVARGIGSALPSSRALGRALEAAGESRAAGDAAHHIVAGGALRAAEARGALSRFGIGINDASNGVFLPKAFHDAMHSHAYYDAVNNALLQASSEQEAQQILSAIKANLKNGVSP